MFKVISETVVKAFCERLPYIFITDNEQTVVS